MQLFENGFLYQFIKTHLFTIANLLQIISIAAGFILAYGISFLFKKALDSRYLHIKWSNTLKEKCSSLIFPIVFCLSSWTQLAASIEFGWDHSISQPVAEFITAWLGVRGLNLLKIQEGIKKLGTSFIYILTTLNVLGLLPHLIVIMDTVALDFGELHISLLSILKAVVTFWLFLWGAVTASRWLELKLKKQGQIAPSIQELFAKFIKVMLISISIFVTLSSAGLDLSVFAIFGGTIGVGIGFGLQKVVSNLICGIILLLDRSIKPGDVIALEQGKSYGEINRLGARCVCVRTRSGKEHLIPNEEFIIHKSENWSLTDSLIRLSLPMRAGLESDVQLVMNLLIEATEKVDRVLTHPAPGARLKAFGDSAIEFDLRVWINDPQRGVSKVRSDIYVNIWKLFKKNNISIPHRQNDIHIPAKIQNKLAKSHELFQ